MTAPDAEELRRRLRVLAADRQRAEALSTNAMKHTRPLVLEAHRLGIGPTELAELAGLSRRTIYDLLSAGEQPGGDA